MAAPTAAPAWYGVKRFLDSRDDVATTPIRVYLNDGQGGLKEDSPRGVGRGDAAYGRFASRLVRSRRIPPSVPYYFDYRIVDRLEVYFHDVDGATGYEVEAIRRSPVLTDGVEDVSLLAYEIDRTNWSGTVAPHLGASQLSRGHTVYVIRYNALIVAQTLWAATGRTSTTQLVASYVELRVRATNDDGVGPWSTRLRFGNETSSSTPWVREWRGVNALGPTPDSAPETPPRPGVEAGAAEVTVTWAVNIAGGTPTSYALEFRIGSGAWTSISTTLTGTTYIHTGRTNGVGYQYRVRGSNANGDSDWSDASATATPAADLVAPAKPVKPTVQPGDAQVVVTWLQPGGGPPDDYDLQFRIGSAAWQEITVGNVLTYTHTGLTNGSSYQYRVRAGNRTGYSDWSDPSTAATPNVPLSSPSALVVTAGNAQVALAWTGEDSTATGYKVEQATKAEGPWAPTATQPSGTTTSLTVAGLNNGTTYFFRVRATGAAGTVPSSWVTSIGVAPVRTPTPPGKPGAPVVSAGDAQVRVSWSAVTATPAVDRYVLSYSKDSGSWVTIPSFFTSTTYTHTGLTNGSSYRYRVRAGSSDGLGGWSDPSSSASPVAPVSKPDKPDAPAVEAGDTQVVVTWAKPTGGAPNGYTLQWQRVGASAWSPVVPAVAGIVLTYTHTGLTNGLAIRYRLKATNSDGDSPWSDTSANVTPSVPLPPPVADLTNFAPGEAGDIGISITDGNATGIPQILGIPIVDGILVADASGIVDPDGVPDTIEYQWFVGGVFLDGQRFQTYHPTAADLGRVVHVVVSFLDGNGSVEALSSEPTNPVFAEISVDSPDVPYHGFEETRRAFDEFAQASELELGDLSGNLTNLAGDLGSALYRPPTPEVSPGPPSGLKWEGSKMKVTTDDASIKVAVVESWQLAWDEPTEIGTSEVTGYDVEIATIGSGFVDDWPGLEEPRVIQTGTGASYASTDLYFGQNNQGQLITFSYEFRVRARNANGPGGWSGVLKVQRPAAYFEITPPPPDTPAPKPTNPEVDQDPEDPGGGIDFSTPGKVPQPSSSCGDRSVTITWSAPPSGGVVTSYRVERQTRRLKWTNWANVNPVWAESQGYSLRYTQTGLTVGLKVRYRVFAVGPQGEGPPSLPSDTCTVVDLTPDPKPGPKPCPDPVHQVDVQQGNRQVQGSHNRPLGIVEWYDLQYRVATFKSTGFEHNDYGQPIDLPSNNSVNLPLINHTGLVNGNKYQYRVRGSNSDCRNNQWSDWLPAGGVIPEAIRPTAPPNFTATGGDREVDLTWDVPLHGRVVSYEIEWQKRTGLGAWAPGTAIKLAGSVRAVTHKPLDNGSGYRYKIRAIGEGLIPGIQTNRWVVATPESDEEPPGKPPIPGGVGGDKAIWLNWNLPFDGGPAHQFEVQRTLYGIRGSTWQTVTRVGGGTTGQTVIRWKDTVRLQYGLYYQYRVRGINDAGEGDWSDASKRILVFGKPGKPDAPDVSVKTTYSRTGGAYTSVSAVGSTPRSNGKRVTGYEWIINARPSVASRFVPLTRVATGITTLTPRLSFSEAARYKSANPPYTYFVSMAAVNDAGRGPFSIQGADTP